MQVPKAFDYVPVFGFNDKQLNLDIETSYFEWKLT